MRYFEIIIQKSAPYKIIAEHYLLKKTVKIRLERIDVARFTLIAKFSIQN